MELFSDRMSADENKRAHAFLPLPANTRLAPYVSTAKSSALFQSQQSIHELLDGTEPMPLRTSMLLRQFFGLNALIQPNLLSPKCAEWRSAALQDTVGATSIVNSPIIFNIDHLFRIAHCPVRRRQASGGRPPNSQIGVEKFGRSNLWKITSTLRRCFSGTNSRVRTPRKEMKAGSI